MPTVLPATPPAATSRSRPINGQALWVVVAGAVLAWGVVRTSEHVADAAPMTTADDVRLDARAQSETILSGIFVRVQTLGGSDADAAQEEARAERLASGLLEKTHNWLAVRDGLRKFNDELNGRYTR
jgi:hypothetical protein